MEVQDESGLLWKFKQPRDQGPRKLIEIGNELMVHDLGRIVGVPTAPTFLANVSGRTGVVSLVESTTNWTHITSNGLQQSVVNLDSFRQLLVFDVWIANQDRSFGRPDHIIAKPVGDRFFVYAIDSSHTLNGCSGELWTAETVANNASDSIDNYSHVSEQEIQLYAQLEPMTV